MESVRSLGESRAAAGVAQLVEHQPSKLRVAGSSPVARLWERRRGWRGRRGHRRYRRAGRDVSGRAAYRLN